MKISLAIPAILFLVLFVLVFLYLYRKYFWYDAISRSLFWSTFLLVALIGVAKVAIFFLYGAGYLPDRTLFYGLPSPKFSGVLWLLPIALSLFVFGKWSREWTEWSPRRFLGALWLIFVLFSLGVAGLREGSTSIQDPFTRTKWEYAGALALVKSPSQFLAEYTQIQSQLPQHAQTHPPGYILILYFLQKIFHANLFGLAILVVLLGGLFVFPVYYFWRYFLSEDSLRTVMPVLIFVPSVVLFSATSMDFLMLLFFWLALAVSLAGWKKGGTLAFLGGTLASAALLLNFLFLFFGLVFCFFFGRLWYDAPPAKRNQLILRGVASLAGFLGFAVLLQWGTGYSFIENFHLANAVHHGVVNAGASSALAYLSFAFINLFAFFSYLGVPTVLVFIKNARSLFMPRDLFVPFPFLFVAFLVATGLFQGEIERLWLFIVPLFIPPIFRSLSLSHLSSFALAALLVFQSIVIQILFYTYW